MNKSILTFENSDWIRDFPGEKIGPLEKVLYQIRGGKLAVPLTALLDRQGQFIDTNFYYRLDGIDAEKEADNCDFLAVQWGIGSRKAETYDQQVYIALANDQHYFSWIILDSDDELTVVQQLEKVMSDPLARVAPIVIDVEAPRSTTRCINYVELQAAVQYLKSISEYRVGIYSRVNILESIFGSSFPDWMAEVWQWIAQYLLFYIDGSWVQAQYYNQFLPSYAWSLPPSVVKSRLYTNDYWRNLVLAWQITSKGDAEYYIAPEWISPGQPGIKSCDLNLTIPALNIFEDRVFSKYNPDPIDPPEETCSWAFQALRNVNYRTEPVVSSGTYVGTLQSGQVIEAISMVNPKTNDFWLTFELDGRIMYTALMYYGTQYYKPI